jgi:ABC-2 type transport system ATP-binding protein
LLLDEPSNGLDPIGIIQLRNFLKELRDAGTTIVISSHRLGELEQLTSDYMFMYRGQVVSFADKLSCAHAGRLRVELVSNGKAIAEKLLLPSKVLSVSDTELEIAIDDPDEVPDIIIDLAQGGARMMGVVLERENIEDVFVRLCNEGT